MNQDYYLKVIALDLIDVITPLKTLVFWSTFGISYSGWIDVVSCANPNLLKHINNYSIVCMYMIVCMNLYPIHSPQFHNSLIHVLAINYKSSHFSCLPYLFNYKDRCINSIGDGNSRSKIEIISICFSMTLCLYIHILSIQMLLILVGDERPLKT